MDVSMAEGALGGGDISGALDPLQMGGALRQLSKPTELAGEAPRLVAELFKIALGLSDVVVPEKDVIFGDPHWRDHPLFRRLAQTHLAWAEAVNRVAEGGDGDWRARERTQYVANILTGVLSPANFLLTNPAALRQAIDTGGVSVLRGARNLLRDVTTNRGMPSMVDSRPFQVGRNLACSPGAVVHREEMFEVLQYTPTTKKVRKRPLIMIPPEVNRHYVLDLAPGKSLVEFAVSQGVQTFCVVWRNPRKDRSLGHGKWGLEDYISAHVRAFDVVREITGSDSLNLLGLCGGGVTSAVTQAHLAARNENPIHAATYLVTMLDGRQPNMATMLDTPVSRRNQDKQAKTGAVVDGRAVRHNFAWMRPRDLVFGFVVNNWLLGNDPQAFDVLVWNDDATNLSSTFARDSSMLLDGVLAEPGGATMLDTPLDMSRVKTDNFVVCGERDHITTWRPCYQTSQLLGGDSQVVLVESGHIQSFVSPPGISRYRYRVGPAAEHDPDTWREQAEQDKGSWWPRWAEWLMERCGAEQDAPAELGSSTHPAREPAPGTYVHEK